MEMQQFFRNQSVKQILQMYKFGFIREKEVMKLALNEIQCMIIFNNYHLSDEEQEIYKSLSSNLFTVPDEIDLLEVINNGISSNNHQTIENAVASTSLVNSERKTMILNDCNNYSPSRFQFGPNKVIQTGKGNNETIKIISEGNKTIKKFNLDAQFITFAFEGYEKSSDTLGWLKASLSKVLEHVFLKTNPEDKVGLVMRSENYPEKPIGISFRRRDQLDADTILSVLGKVLQSNQTFFAKDVLTLEVSKVKLPTGYGRIRLVGSSFEEFCKKKNGIIVVPFVDNICLASALIISIAFKKNDERLKTFIKNLNLLKTESLRLCHEANVDLSNGGNLEHIKQFQNYLIQFTIVVYNSRKGDSVYFEGPRTKDRTVLNLILENNHYNVIKSLTSAFTTAYFCEFCRFRTSRRELHKNCKFICPCCHEAPPCQINLPNIKCKNCNRDFRGQDCFTSHSKNLCKILIRCSSCLLSVWVNKTEKHICGFKMCNICKEVKPIKHLCYISPDNNLNKKTEKTFLFVFYDLECRQEKKITNDTYLHEANICVAQHVCNKCILLDVDIRQNCDFCKNRLHIFNNENPIEEFLSYISRISRNFNKITVFAHNGKAYDNCFIMRSLISNRNKWDPKVITTGTKLISITCDNIRFIDSINYIPLPLSEIPNIFNLPEVKGYFPFLFNMKENYNYVGRIPDINFYCPQKMSSEGRLKFLHWYKEQEKNNYLFNFKDEILKYCIADVDILRKACIKFWHMFLNENNVDPFQEATTIASACNLVYRRLFLKKDTIAVIPFGGYRKADKQSKVAIGWLVWMSNRLNKNILHAGNSREVRLQKVNILVDGFSPSDNTVYQFHGCYFHGCERCYPNQTISLSDDLTDSMFTRREKTETTSTRIKNAGYNIIEIWECEWKRFIKDNERVNLFLRNNNFIIEEEPLHIRDAFFGGRTNTVKLYYKCDIQNNERIRYFDVCSLYPYVNKYGKYPVGHPTLHIGKSVCNKISLNNFEGIIKCTILPPMNLYHPVLPSRMRGKLMFVLCRTCGETLFTGTCNHTDKERQLTGTWVSDEIKLAISLNYKVIDVFEMWEYKIAQYDKNSKTGGLFDQYVTKFIKLKQECSGWPNWCTDDVSKDKYIKNYFDKEGVQLDKDKIEKNKGLRYIAKLMLNSFWGKFGQRENLQQTSIISDPNEFFNILTNPSIEVHALTLIDDISILINWDRVEESVIPLKTVSVAIAAYTTALARIELYKYLNKLGERVLYFDTDSVIFTEKPGEWIPPTGCYLGDMTDEILDEYGETSFISEFVSAGPKNYAFNVFNPTTGENKTKCKVKGITLNYENSNIIDFNKIKDTVINNLGKTYIYNERKIVRNPSYQVISKPETKTYQLTCNKRKRINDSYDTLPYGYR